jgi:hypothetical protein
MSHPNERMPAPRVSRMKLSSRKTVLFLEQLTPTPLSPCTLTL